MPVPKKQPKQEEESAVDINMYTQCVEMVFQRIVSGNISTVKDIIKALSSVNKNIYGL